MAISEARSAAAPAAPRSRPSAAIQETLALSAADTEAEADTLASAEALALADILRLAEALTLALADKEMPSDAASASCAHAKIFGIAKSGSAGMVSASAAIDAKICWIMYIAEGSAMLNPKSMFASPHRFIEAAKSRHKSASMEAASAAERAILKSSERPTSRAPAALKSRLAANGNETLGIILGIASKEASKFSRAKRQTQAMFNPQ